MRPTMLTLLTVILLKIFDTALSSSSQTKRDLGAVLKSKCYGETSDALESLCLHHSPWTRLPKSYPQEPGVPRSSIQTLQMGRNAGSNRIATGMLLCWCSCRASWLVWVSLPGVAASHPTSGSPWCIQSPKAENALRQPGFFRSLGKLQIYIYTTFHQVWHSQSIFPLCSHFINAGGFFQGWWIPLPISHGRTALHQKNWKESMWSLQI